MKLTTVVSVVELIQSIFLFQIRDGRYPSNPVQTELSIPYIKKSTLQLRPGFEAGTLVWATSVLTLQHCCV